MAIRPDSGPNLTLRGKGSSQAAFLAVKTGHRSGSDLDDHLAHGFIRLQPMVGFADVAEIENAVDIRAQNAAGQQGRDLIGKLLRDLDLFSQGPGPQHRAPDLQAPAQHVAAFQFVCSAGDGPNKNHAAFVRENSLARLDVGAADQVKHNVDAFPGSPPLRGGEQFVEIFTDYKPGFKAERAGSFDFVGRTRSSVGDGWNRAKKLHRREPHAAADGVNEHAFAGAQARLRPKRVMGGDEDLRNGRSLGEAEVGGHLGQQVFTRYQEFRVGAAADQAKDALPGLPAANRRADLSDLASEFDAGNFRGKAGRRRVFALALQEVGAIEG